MKQTQKNSKVILNLAAKLAADHVDKIRPEIVRQATAVTSVTMCICLADKFDFTPEQLNTLLRYMADQMDSVLKEYLTIEDIETWCRENGVTALLDLKEENK